MAGVVGGRVVRGFVLPPYNLVPGDWVLGIFFLSFFSFSFPFGISLVLYSFLRETLVRNGPNLGNI